MASFIIEKKWWAKKCKCKKIRMPKHKNTRMLSKERGENEKI